MKATGTRLYTVAIAYNVEAEDAVKAIDKVIGSHPLIPLSINCEPIEVDDDDCD